jgi:hypothetical protein
MGSRQIEQGVLLYNSSLDGPAPADHFLLRSIDRQGGADDTELPGARRVWQRCSR